MTSVQPRTPAIGAPPDSRSSAHTSWRLFLMVCVWMCSCLGAFGGGLITENSLLHNLQATEGTSSVVMSSDVVPTISTDTYAQQLFERTNQARTSQGLAPLTLNPALVASAQAKLNDMVTTNYWSHYSNTGQSPWVFFNQAGYRYSSAGENLALGFATPDEAVQHWLASPTHRENLLNPAYKEVGFAVYYGKFIGLQNVLVVQHFGAR